MSPSSIAYLRLADSKDLVVSVENGKVRSTGAYVDHAIVVRGELDGTFGRHGIRRVEANGVGQRAEEGEIFQSHLGRSILADGNASVGTDVFRACEADRAHADLIGCTDEERGECVNETDVTLTCSDADRHGNHVLFGNEAFDESFGIGVLNQ